MAGKGSCAWRARIDGQIVDSLGNGLAGDRVKLPKRAAARGRMSSA
jgi:hypothetical protein